MLAIRLSVAGLVIAVLIGGMVLINERKRVSDIVLEYAVQGTLNFNVHAVRLLEKGPPFDRLQMQEALETFIRKRVRIKRGYSNGYFVLVRVLDGKGEILAETRDSAYENIQTIVSRLEMKSLPLSAVEDGTWQTMRISGKPYVRVVAPLKNSSGSVTAYVKGIFVISDQAIAKARKKVIRSMVYVIGIVLVTTILLYPVILSLLRRLTGLTRDLLDSHMATLNVLGSAIAKRDSDTDIHNYRVTITSTRIAELLGLDEDTIRTLIKGAFLHDVGKIGIPDNILLKPGRLTRDEYKVMKTHVDNGIDIVNRSHWLDDASAVVVGHHEKVDGSGYPNGLKGDDNPMTARIFAIVDVFDALTSRRPYKEPKSFEETMGILEEGRGSHFDSELLDAFSKIARPLYDDFASQSEEAIRKDLDAIIKRYFSV